MDNKEHRKAQSNEHQKDLSELKELGDRQQEVINGAINEKESTLENKSEELEKARHEALEKAAKLEKREKEITEKTSPKAERHRGPISKKEKDAAFTATMREVQSQMSSPSRTFSKIIHNRAVEKTSEVVGSTVARPNAILSGAFCAFILVLGIYLIARHYGYPLSGTETIAAFIAGWVIGLVYDYFRLLFVGKDK